jgi:hypothetical protein
METEKKEGKNIIGYILYFFLLVLLLIFLFLYSFNVISMKADKFTIFLLSLIFVSLLLPLAYYLKIFTVVEIRRDLDAFKKESNEKFNALEGSIKEMKK